MRLAAPAAIMLPLLLLLLLWAPRGDAAAAAAAPSYYDLLGVPRDAPAKAIQKAFRQLSLQQHPDKARRAAAAGAAASAPRAAAADYAQVQRAYRVLSDPDLRMLYDEYGAAIEGSDAQRRAAAAPAVQARLTFFRHDPAVVPLRNGDEHRLAGALDRPWLILFYAPWSGASQAAIGEWRRVAGALDGVATVAAANCVEAGLLCRQYRIQQAVPVVLLLLPSEEDVEEYRGPLSADALSAFVRNSLTGARDVVELPAEAAAFAGRVQRSRDFWLVLFCDGSLACFHTKPHIRRMASSLKGIARVGLVPCRGPSDPFCEEFDVADHGLPLLVAFPRGEDKPERGEVIPLRVDERAEAPAQTFLTAIDAVLRLALSAASGGPADAPTAAAFDPTAASEAFPEPGNSLDPED